MPKIEIEVDQILTAAVPLEVEAGDRLLVMNGVVIGLVERRVRPVAAAASQPAKRADAPKAKPRMAGALVMPRVIDALRHNPPMTARRLAEYLSIDVAHRDGLKSALRMLREENRVVPADTARFPTYKLVEAPAVNGMAT